VFGRPNVNPNARTAHEDVAHVLTCAPQASVVTHVESYLAPLGYTPLALRGRKHLLSKPDWNSPFDPAPEYRCFNVFPVHGEWCSLADELDRVDWVLATSLAVKYDTWALRGWRELREFEWLALAPAGHWRPGLGPSLPDVIHESLHLTYDEILLGEMRQRSKVFGFSRGRPYAPPAGA